MKCTNKFSAFVTDDVCMVEHEKLISHKLDEPADSVLEDGHDNVASDSDVQSNVVDSDENTCYNNEINEFNANNEDAKYVINHFDEDDDYSDQNVENFSTNHKGMYVYMYV